MKGFLQLVLFFPASLVRSADQVMVISAGRAFSLDTERFITRQHRSRLEQGQSV